MAGQNPLMGASGARDITKIEIELLDNGNCRWLLWDGTDRLHCAVAHPGEFPKLLQATRVVMETMAGIRQPGR